MPWQDWHRVRAFARTSTVATESRHVTSRWCLAIQRLIARQLDVVLSLVDKEGNPSLARLYVRVTQDSIPIVAGDALKQAQTSAKKLTRPLISDVSDALLYQQSLVTSFDALLKQFKPMVKIGDEISKVFSLFFPAMIRNNFFLFYERSILMSISRGQCFRQE